MSQNSLELLGEFQKAAEKKDAKKIVIWRDKIREQELTSADDIAALYRVGLHALHEERNVELALDIFKKLAAASVSCEERHQAQISYAVVLWIKNKHQQAIFELRKVLSQAKPKSIHVAIALDYLAIFLRDSKAAQKDIAKTDEQRIEAYEQLAKEAIDVDEKTELTFKLAVVLEERNQKGDIARAHALIRDIAALSSKMSKINEDVTKKVLKKLGPARQK